MAAPVPVRLAARSPARRAMRPEWSREPAQAVARKRSGPEGFLDDEERSRKEPRRVAELKEPRAGSGERTAFQYERAEQSGRGRPPQGPCRFAGAKRKSALLPSSAGAREPVRRERRPELNPCGENKRGSEAAGERDERRLQSGRTQ